MNDAWSSEVVDLFLSVYEKMIQQGRKVYAKRFLYLLEKALIVNGNRHSLKSIYRKKDLLENSIDILYQLLDDEEFRLSSNGPKLSMAIGDMSIIVRNDFVEHSETINDLIGGGNCCVRDTRNADFEYNDAILLAREMIVDRRISKRETNKMIGRGIDYQSMVSFDVLYYYSKVTGYELEITDIEKPTKHDKMVFTYLSKLALNKIVYDYMPNDVVTIRNMNINVPKLKLER